MRLLVSVANRADAAAALEGGADIIDAKDPRVGALGAVSIHALRDIHAEVAGERPVTAALGDDLDGTALESTAKAFTTAGAALVKVGFADPGDFARIEMLIESAVRGVRAANALEKGVIAVAYADRAPGSDRWSRDFVETAARAGAAGVLLDTGDKGSAGLRTLVSKAFLEAWVRHAHDSGLTVALAGKLTTDDLPFVRDVGADIAGVRGAACDQGRTGRIVAEKVRLLQEGCGPVPVVSISVVPTSLAPTSLARAASRAPATSRELLIFKAAV
jgi:uncharacterized protein (UPF0264 family)